MKSVPNQNLMQNLLNDFDKNRKDFNPLDTKRLHKKHQWQYHRKKRRNNLKKNTKDFESTIIFPEFNNNDKSHDYPNKEYYYENFFDKLLSDVSSKYIGEEYSSQYDLQSALEGRLQEKNNLEEFHDNSLNKPTEIISETDKPTKPNKTTKGLPPLCECSKSLLNRVRIINNDDKLYFFNGKCYDPVGKYDIAKLYREKVDDKIGSSSSMYNIFQLEDFMLSDPSICIEDMNYNLRIAVLKNCIYDVEKRQKCHHTSDIITFSYIDADFVDDPYCPYFDKFLKNVFQNDSILIERMWQILGYLFMQTNEAKSFFFMGEASDSGKSLLGNFIQSLYPKQYVSNIPLHDFNTRFGSVRLVGSAINISLDLPAAKLKDSAVSKIKMLTGGDYINVEEKCKPIFKYRNRAKLLFASNFPISLYEEDDAFWNRLVYIPFDISVPPEKQDRTLADKFMNEKDSIVSKALIHARTLIKNDFIFPSTSDIDARIRQWKVQDIPSVDYFLEKYCVINSEYKGELVAKLYYAYEHYCQNEDYAPKSRIEFKKYLEKNVGLKHFKMRDGGENPQSAFKGIKLISSDFNNH